MEPTKGAPFGKNAWERDIVSPGLVIEVECYVLQQKLAAVVATSSLRLSYCR